MFLYSCIVCSVLFNRNVTSLVSLLQPPPEVFNLFDDVLLLDEGRLVYHGPRDRIVAHFQAMGYRIPARKDVADFLQEVTMEGGETYFCGRDAATRRYSVSGIASLRVMDSATDVLALTDQDRDHENETEDGDGKEEDASDTRGRGRSASALAVNAVLRDPAYADMGTHALHGAKAFAKAFSRTEQVNE